MRATRRFAGIVGCLAAAAASLLPRSAAAQAHPAAAKTQVVLLGTGTPLPDPERAGPSVAIVVNGEAYIVDAGVGLVRRAAAAAKTIDALRPVKLHIAFLTHLHSDHTLGLPDLMVTPWIMGRTAPLEIYGPAGMQEAYTEQSYAMVSPQWQQYRSAFHMSTRELGALATKAKPKLLILFHRGNAGCDQLGTEACRKAGSEARLLAEVRQAYAGRVIAGHDLDIY